MDRASAIIRHVSRSVVQCNQLTALLMVAYAVGVQHVNATTPPIRKNDLANANFVEVEVAKIVDVGPESLLEIVIREVFFGDCIEVGDRFSASVLIREQGSFGGSIVLSNPVKVGQRFYWVIKDCDSNIVISRIVPALGLEFYPSSGFYALPMPVIPRQQSWIADSARALSLEIRRVSELDSNERRKALEKLCGSESYAVAGWAMSVLASADKRESLPFLRRASASKESLPLNREMAKSLIRKLEVTKTGKSSSD